MDLAERPSSADFRRHPWEVCRFHFFSGLLRDRGILSRPRRVLDVGSGDGWFLKSLLEVLPQGSCGIGWDTGYDTTTRELSPMPHAASFTRDEPAGRFDLMLMLDVLEHVEDDLGFLVRCVSNRLEPGGAALVSVPAGPWLLTAHDSALNHFRRYDRRSCMTLLTQAGLEIRLSGGLFHSLVVPRALSRLREQLSSPVGTPGTPRSLEWRHGVVVTRLVTWAFQADTWLSFQLARRRIFVPGLSFWALCTKDAPGE